MRNAMRFVIPILMFFVAEQPISAQQGIVLDNVTNSSGTFSLIGGQTHVLSFRFRNFPSSLCLTAGLNVNNGFVLTSPDGATWSHVGATLTPAFLNLSWVQEFARSINDPLSPFPGGGDGFSPDYVSVGATSLSSGLPDGFDDIALEIEIVTNRADSNLHICIDSSSQGVLNTWLWPSIPAIPCNVAPDWGGPYCFTIVATCCQGSVGNVDFDDAGLVDISDLTVLIDHLFINFPPLPCVAEANIDGDPAGTVDITDLTALIDHLFINFPPLPTCQ